jgi:hypothetical protein
VTADSLAGQVKSAHIHAITACEMIDKNDSTRRELRMLLGFIVVIPTAVLIALATYDALWQVGWLPQGAPIDAVDAAASLGTGVAILAVVVTVFGAIPAVVWMNGRRPLSLRNLLVLGAVLGNVPFVFIVVGISAAHLASGTLSTDVGQYWYGRSGAMIRTMLGLICGMGSAVVFWLVGVRGNERRFARRE